MNYFVIYDGSYWWNNDDGWTNDLHSATVFTKSERDTFRLPMAGDWQMLPEIPKN